MYWTGTEYSSRFSRPSLGVRVELFNELVCNVTQAAICGEH